MRSLTALPPPENSPQPARQGDFGACLPIKGAYFLFICTLEAYNYTETARVADLLIKCSVWVAKRDMDVSFSRRS
jgi:hypothetical protein